MMRLSVTIEPGRIDLDKRLTRSVLRAAGTEVAAVARAMIRRSAGGGRVYYLHGSAGGHGRYRASTPGQPPVSVSGALAQSIKVRPFKSGEGVAIRDTAYYALFLERGATGGGGNTRNKANILAAGEIGRRGRVLRGKNRMKTGAINQSRVLAARPFLSTALAQRETSIANRIRASIVDGLKFKRIRA